MFGKMFVTEAAIDKTAASSSLDSEAGMVKKKDETKPLLDVKEAWAIGEVVAKGWRDVAADVRWGFRESHNVIVTLNYPSSIAGGLSYEEQCRHPCVRYNPVYWMCTLVTMPCMVSGRWTHALLGQGGPVRDDEMAIERDARVQWIYTTGAPRRYRYVADLFSRADGPFAFSAFLTIVYLLWLACRGNAGENVDTAGVVVDIAIDVRGLGADRRNYYPQVSYIGGNYRFLEAMRHKRVAEVRMCILSTFAFTSGLAVLLVSGILHADIASQWSWSRRATWLLRFLCVAFFTTATIIYSQLWNAYGTHRRSTSRLSDGFGSARVGNVERRWASEMIVGGSTRRRVPTHRRRRTTRLLFPRRSSSGSCWRSLPSWARRLTCGRP